MLYISVYVRIAFWRRIYVKMKTAALSPSVLSPTHRYLLTNHNYNCDATHMIADCVTALVSRTSAIRIDWINWFTDNLQYSSSHHQEAVYLCWLHSIFNSNVRLIFEWSGLTCCCNHRIPWGLITSISKDSSILFHLIAHLYKQNKYLNISAVDGGTD